jgi:hypothetical protein
LVFTRGPCGGCRQRDRAAGDAFQH